LGWSYVERVAFQAFSEELQAAPAGAQAPLGKLATLYGLTRVERGLAFFLASGEFNFDLLDKWGGPQINMLCLKVESCTEGSEA
jgi:hypothetical protein